MELNEIGTDTEVVATDTVMPYQVYAMPDANQAESFANYLTRHGRDAAAGGNEVTVPTPTLADTAAVFQLLSHWKLFWRFSEKELYGLPVYSKPACKDHQQ